MRGVVTLAAAFVIPENTAAPRRAPADRLHRDRRNAVPPGSLAAVARPSTAGALPRPGGRRPRPGQPAAPGLTGRAGRAREARGGRPARRQRADPRPGAPARQRRVGAVQRQSEETPSDVYARRRKADDRRRARVACWRSAAPARSRTRWSTRCSGCSTWRSRCSTTPRRSASACARAAPGHPRGGLRAPAAGAPPVEADTPGECGDCLRAGTTWVHLRMCVGLRPHRLLRLIARAARERPPRRHRPRGDAVGRGR